MWGVNHSWDVFGKVMKNISKCLRHHFRLFFLTTHSQFSPLSPVDLRITSYIFLSFPFFLMNSSVLDKGFPGGTGGKEHACQFRRHKRYGFHLWVGKIPWKRAWQSTPVFLPGECPCTNEPGRLQSIGSQRVRHDRSDLEAVSWISHCRNRHVAHWKWKLFYMINKCWPLC